MPDTQLPKLKGVDSLYRYIALLGALLTAVQGIIWTIVALIAMAFYISGGKVAMNDNRHILYPFTVNLAALYFDRDEVHTPRNHMIPVYVFILMFVYFVASINLTAISISSLKIYTRWSQTKKIYKCAVWWTISTILMCVLDLISFKLFLADFILLLGDEYDDGLEIVPATMMTIAIRGGLLWILNLGLSLTMFYLHFINKQKPV